MWHTAQIPHKGHKRRKEKGQKEKKDYTAPDSTLQMIGNKRKKLKDKLLDDRLKKKLRHTITSPDAFLAPTSDALLDEGMEAHLGDYQTFTASMDHKINKNKVSKHGYVPALKTKRENISRTDK